MLTHRWFGSAGILLTLTLPASPAAGQGAGPPRWLAGATRAIGRELGAGLHASDQSRLHRGLDQIATLWRTADGDSTAFAALVRDNFAADQPTLDTMFARFERNFEQLDGHLHEIDRVFRSQADLDLGPLHPVDETLAGYDVSAHVADDFFANGIAFTVLLNFPLTTLEERLAQGDRWSRREWAEARLAQRFSRRIPATVQLAIARAGGAAEGYIAGYNLWMHHLIGPDGQRPFPTPRRPLPSCGWPWFASARISGTGITRPSSASGMLYSSASTPT